MQDLPLHKAMKTQAGIETLEVCWSVELHSAWLYCWLAIPDSIPTQFHRIWFPEGVEFTFLVPLYGYRAKDRPDTVVT